MASKRQRAANRRNATKSSGPRSSAGRRRASRNSYRHGLAASLRTTTAQHAWRVEKLARKIAGNTADPVVLEYARAAARAEFDLAQVRSAKVATIQQVLALGQLGGFEGEIAALVRASSRGGVSEAAPDMPSEEPYRTAEAVRRGLPALIKLDRYEREAAARRAQALRELHKHLALKL